jgi:hypothetical protein
MRALTAAALFPVVALVWLWNVTGIWGYGLAIAALVMWRRRRRTRRLAAAAAAVAVLLLVAPSGARAQAFLDERSTVSEEDLTHWSRWGFALRVGPYFPGIDEEPGVTGDPFARVYGSGPAVLFGFELEFYILRNIGQLGVSVAASTLGKSGHSFMTDMNGQPTDMRSEDTTSFRMFPLSVSAVYRLTQLADRTIIPLVPYARAGLSYYIWRFTKGNGNVAAVGEDEAFGATLGWQATIGLAIRADRLDAEAARALRSELGVEHAGFFVELTYADVSGLGQSNKLQVGDLTWAAGINFEF